ncbi:oligosaccharide flippase family protein [Prevotella denticola]|uniref:oligosaccharide flippase family protein n=1 Tax=Prevotella denticola TaxID=28129 RepID=UPI003C729192
MSNIVMLLLPLVVTPILSRLYLPAEFGEWGVFSSFVSIYTLAVFAGYENTIVKATEKEIPYTSALCIILSLSITVITTVVFYLGNAEGTRFFREFPSSGLLFFYLTAYSLHTIFSNMCNRYGRYSGIAMESIVLGSSQAGLRILFGLLVLSNINGLILGTTLAQIVTAVFLFMYLIRIKKCRVLWAFSLQKMRAIIIKYKNFALYDAPSSILCFAGFNVPLLILVTRFNKATIGSYSIILQLLLLPMTIIGSAIGRIYYEQLCSDETKDNRLKIQQRTIQVGKVVSLISFLPMLFLACGGDKLIVLFLGSKWTISGGVALCLAFWSFPTILTQPLIPLFRYLNKQRILFYYNSLYAIISIGTIIAGCNMSNNIYHILTFYTFTCSSVNLAMFFHVLRLANISTQVLKKYIPFWILSSIVLIIRIILI